MWTSADIEIVLDDELTDGAIATVRILTPLGELLVMAEAEQNERESVLRRLLYKETLWGRMIWDRRV